MNKQYTPGDKLKITTKTAVYEGILLQRPATLPDTTMIIKLDIGYNIGIAKKEITALTCIEKYQQKQIPKSGEQRHDKTKKTISILHTGGTIASRVDYTTGAVVAKFTPADILQQLPELQDIANIRSELVTNLQSESMRPAHYNLLAKAIQREITNKTDGIIITHGTDTLHYTAAALSFMLEHLNIPVLLVGAQRSPDRGSSDAFMNVLGAAKFITMTDYAGVSICMHSTTNDKSVIILSGTKTRKLHTSRRDAFRAVNSLPIAEINMQTHQIVYFQAYQKQKKTYEKLQIKPFKENVKVGLLKTHIFTYPDDYAHYLHHDGLIIEGTGLGHAQTKGFDVLSAINEENKKAIAAVAKKIPVVMASQCIYGRVNMHVYTPQRELLEIGVVGAEDMTAETALVKLAWLLSNYKNIEEIKQLMQTNLRGEITERSVIETVCDN